MFSPLSTFQVGTLYSNEDVYRSLGVGNAGGIRAKTWANGSTQRLIIMTSLPNAKLLAENPYHDRLEGDVLVYTGAGKVGNQALMGANARIPRQVNDRFPIWCFQLQTSRRDKSSGPKRWMFLGLLQFLRSYTESQIDSSGELRLAHIFELRVLNRINEVAVDLDCETMATHLEESPLDNTFDETDREVDVTEATPDSSPDDAAKLEEIRRELLRQDSREFEMTISALLVRTGFQDVEVTRYSQDGGIDVNARPGTSVWPMRHLLLQVQAKRWLHTVGRREVAELRGSILPHAVGCIVTTSHFSKAAILESSMAGKVPIALVNGHELASLIQRADTLPD